MNVFDILHKDHQDALELFRTLKGAPPGKSAEKARLFEKLNEELTIHMVVEEKYFYSHIHGSKPHGKDLESHQEHTAARTLLAQLAAGDMDSEEWDSKLGILEHNFEQHVREEEEHVFSRSRRMLSKAEAESIGLEIEEHKSRYLALEG